MRTILRNIHSLLQSSSRSSVGCISLSSSSSSLRQFIRRAKSDCSDDDVFVSSDTSLPRLRIVALNDVSDLSNLSRLQTFLKSLVIRKEPAPDAIVMCGNFLSPPPFSSLEPGALPATFGAVGITHVSLGSREVELKLADLCNQLRRLLRNYKKNRMNVAVLNSNVRSIQEKQDRNLNNNNNDDSLNSVTRPFEIVTTSCGRIRVALIGLLSDEPGIVPDRTWRGYKIENVQDSLINMHRQLILQRGQDDATTNGTADWILPMTHQSIQRDYDLAHTLWQIQAGQSLIIGGHDDDPRDVTITQQQQRVNDNRDNPLQHSDTTQIFGNNGVRIVKAGGDAEGVNLIDLTFQQRNKPNDMVQLKNVDVTWVDLKRDYEPSEIINDIIQKQRTLVTSMEHQILLDADGLLPAGTTLSSKGARYQQTTVGGIVCLAIKREMQVDVAIISGSILLGDTDYAQSTMTYAQLKKELQLPTKMVVASIKRSELLFAMDCSQTQNPSNENRQDGGIIDGCLQVDLDFDREGIPLGNTDDDLQVALPQNLLSSPLFSHCAKGDVEGIREEKERFPTVLNLVVRHFAKERWYDMVHHQYSFSDLDLGHKGYLSRDDVFELLHRSLKQPPPEFLVTDMMNALDADNNGIIDPGEFSHMLAIMEREHSHLF